MMKLSLMQLTCENNGAIKGLPDEMVVETQAVVSGKGISEFQ